MSEAAEEDPMAMFFALAYQKTLLELARRDNSDWQEAIRRITRVDADTLKCDRVSVWLYDSARSGIVCECLFQISTGDYDKGIRLEARDYPRYFHALEENRTVAADDALVDSRTSEFAEGYLKPLGITSMMDVPIRLHGHVIGVICHEHTGPMRIWSKSDQDFGASIADLVALSYEASRRRQAEEELRRLNLELQKKVALLEKLQKKSSSTRRGKSSPAQKKSGRNKKK